MTEKELTEMAMAKAAGEAPKAEAFVPPKTSKKTVKPKEVKETENPKAAEIKLLKNQVDLGGRIATLVPWNGKTKKKFKKVFEFIEDPRDVDFKKLMKVLVIDQVKEDISLADAEIQYIMAELYDISISGDVSVETDCPSCGNPTKITSTIAKDMKFEKNQLPKKHKDIMFENVPYSTVIKNVRDIMEDDNYDGITTEADIETATRIKIPGKNIKQTINYLDELSIKEIEELMKSYEAALPKFTLEHTQKCRDCDVDQEFEVELITNLFELLMK